MQAAPFLIDPAGGRFSFEDARRACDFALRHPEGPLIVIDLTRAADATTSAFAQLVVLRRELLRSGRDLRLLGLHDRAAHVYCVNRLGGVLPVQQAAVLAGEPRQKADHAISAATCSAGTSSMF